MQSVIQKKFYNSVQVFWLNRELLQKRIAEAVIKIASDCPDVERVIIFGSVAEQKETPLSDVDILIIVRDAKCRFLERSLFFKDYFQDIGLGADIFVYTQDELEQKNIPLAKIALKEGRVLFEKQMKIR